MEVKRPGGFTLIEVLIASALSLMLALVAGSIFIGARHMLNVSTTSYLISRDLGLGVEKLKQDLKGTALGTVRVTTGKNPAVACLTPYSSEGDLSLDPQGVPSWQGWVHFVLLEGRSPDTGTLVRWMELPAQPPSLPAVSPTSSLTVPAGVPKKVILRDVARPGSLLAGVGANGLQLSDDDGFAVRFVRASGTLSSQNPAHFTAKGSGIDQNTRLLEVVLRTYTRRNTGRADTIGLRFRICPRY